MREHAWPTIVLIGLSMTACQDGQPPPAEPVVRDSAGIRIVENADIGWDAAAAWVVADTPSLDLGSIDADPEYQFYRVVGAATLSDGRIVVASGGTQEVRWYDPAGTLVATAGGEGQGPGEFTGLVALGVLPGDSVLAYDMRLQRFTVFDADAADVRSVPLEQLDRPGMRFPVLLGVLDDGALVMVGRDLQTEGMAEGPVRAPMPVYVYGPDGTSRDSIGTFHGWEASVTIRRNSQQVAMAIGDRPFGHSTTVTSVGDGIVVGTPHSYELAIFRPDGALRSIVRLDRPAQLLTAADIEAYEAFLASQAEDNELAREQRREAAELEYPETKPAYASAIRGDRLGNIWVPGFAVSEEQRPPLWAVFDREGRYLGELELPGRLRVFEIGSDYVLGVWRDELDVEHVRRYPLIKPN
jgi:hypothetical protein